MPARSARQFTNRISFRGFASVPGLCKNFSTTCLVGVARRFDSAQVVNPPRPSGGQ